MRSHETREKRWISKQSCHTNRHQNRIRKISIYSLQKVVFDCVQCIHRVRESNIENRQDINGGGPWHCFNQHDTRVSLASAAKINYQLHIFPRQLNSNIHHSYGAESCCNRIQLRKFKSERKRWIESEWGRLRRPANRQSDWCQFMIEWMQNLSVIPNFPNGLASSITNGTPFFFQCSCCKENGMGNLNGRWKIHFWFMRIAHVNFSSLTPFERQPSLTYNGRLNCFFFSRLAGLCLHAQSTDTRNES